MICKCIKKIDQFDIGQPCDYKICEDFWGSYYTVTGVHFSASYSGSIFLEYFEIIK